MAELNDGGLTWGEASKLKDISEEKFLQPYISMETKEKIDRWISIYTHFKNRKTSFKVQKASGLEGVTVFHLTESMI